MNRPIQILIPAVLLVAATVWLLPDRDRGTLPAPLRLQVSQAQPGGGAEGGPIAGPLQSAVGAGAQESGPVVVQAPKDPAATGPSWTIQGRVLDPLGWPVAGAAVTLRTHEGAPLDTAPGAKTDADGAYTLVGQGPDPVVDVWVEAADFATAWVAAQPVVGDPLDVVLRPALPWSEDGAPRSPTWAAAMGRTAVLSGEGFLEDASGQPVPDALVTVAETGFAARSDELGRYRVRLPQRPCTLLVQDPVGRLQTSTVPVPERASGLVPLPRLVLLDDRPGLALRGMVRGADGEPAAGGSVRIYGPGIRRTVPCDAQGRFGLGALPAGEYRVVATPHRGFLAALQTVELTGRDADFDLPLAAASPLQLQVVDRVARPMAGVQVAAFLPPLDGVDDADAQGGWRLMAVRQADEVGQLALSGVGGLADDQVRFEVRRAEDLSPLAVDRAELEAPAGQMAQLVVAAD